MIPIASGVRVWIATGHTDMRRGMQSLALQVQEGLKRYPHAGDLYVFRGPHLPASPEQIRFAGQQWAVGPRGDLPPPMRPAQWITCRIFRTFASDGFFIE